MRPAAAPIAFPGTASLRKRGIDLAFLPAALAVMDTPASPAARHTAGSARLRSSLSYLQQKRDRDRSLMRSQLAAVPAQADTKQAAVKQQQILVPGEHAGVARA